MFYYFTALIKCAAETHMKTQYRDPFICFWIEESLTPLLWRLSSWWQNKTLSPFPVSFVVTTNVLYLEKFRFVRVFPKGKTTHNSSTKKRGFNQPRSDYYGSSCFVSPTLLIFSWTGNVNSEGLEINSQQGDPWVIYQLLIGCKHSRCMNCSRTVCFNTVTVSIRLSGEMFKDKAASPSAEKLQ